MTPSAARHELAVLMRVFAAGMREPVPLTLKTSAEYALRRERNNSRENAAAGAEKRWLPYTYQGRRIPGERDDVAYALVHGSDAAFELLTAEPAGEHTYPDESTRFGALARLVWAPLLAVERAG